MSASDGSTVERWADVLASVGVLLVGLALVATGTALATWVTTDGGAIAVEETTVETESGTTLSATVYEPASASPDDPAPAVTLIHGYTGERGTMASFAREFAGRGYVAVAVDQPGHGASEPPALADDWGGPATLAYARSLPTVDEERVAMVGHSMGGFASLAGAEAYPDGYRSIVLVGSTWGDDGDYRDVPVANETFPRNLALLFAPYDEFSQSMYGEGVPGDVPESEKVRAVFGTEGPVEAGETYGSVENGTARWFAAPPTIHTGMHRSTSTVAATVNWVERTAGPADGNGDVETNGQAWYWATAGHVLALAGTILVGIGAATLSWRRLAGVDSWRARRERPRATPEPSRGVLLALAALPALTLYPLYAIGTYAVPVTRLTPQQLTHGYVLWVVGTVALGWAVAARAGVVSARVGPAALPARDRAGRALAAAAVGAAAMTLVVAAVTAVPGGEARAWIVGLGTLTPLRWLALLLYGPPLVLGTVAFAFGLDRLRPEAWGLGRVLGLTAGGLLIFLAIQYAPLFAGRGLPVPVLGPLAITAIRATGLLVVATVVVDSCNRLTGRSLVGGALAGYVLAWAIVSTSPFHVTIL